MSAWTNEEIATLQQLWDKGHTGTDIGIMMDRPRGAILGKIFRLQGNAQIQRRLRTNKKNVRQPKIKPCVVTRPAAWSPLPGTEPVSLDRLESTSCRWPIDTDDGSRKFCGQEAAQGPCQYCEYHRFISFRGVASAETHVEHAP